MADIGKSERDGEAERVERSARLKLGRIGAYVAPVVVGTLELSPIAAGPRADGVDRVACLARVHPMADRA